MLIIFLSTLSIFFHPAASKQYYDPNACPSTSFSPFSRYTCNNTSLTSCDTFLVYRSQQGFDTVSSISALFSVNQLTVLYLNNFISASEVLDKDRDIILPIQCSCLPTGYFQSNMTYNPPSGATYTDIACDTFRALTKLPALIQQNPNHVSNLTVPLQCACPDITDRNAGFRYLVTYPVLEFDTGDIIAERFGIPPSDISEENIMNIATININTTILVPLRATPVINSSVKSSQNEPPGFIPLIPTPPTKHHARRNIYLIVSGVGFFLLTISSSALALYYYKFKKKERKQIEAFSARSSAASFLSPDLLAVLSKYSLLRYSSKELSEATKGFSDETKLGASVHKGKFGETELVIKNMGFGDARRIIGIHSKINHANIVKLEGVCYGETCTELTFSPSYLVFEYARNGCLRDCISSKNEVVPWSRRARIAFDVAIALHYIHQCTVPSYIHMNINSRNVLITTDWRAKIANFGVGSVVDSAKERVDVVMNSEGWVAPEYVNYGTVSTKIDVFAFGVVLLELVSGKQVNDRGFVDEELRFLTGAGSGDGCFSELREFVDPRMEDYPITEALCVTVLAKACVEDDPLHRPSMDDILKILARMER